MIYSCFDQHSGRYRYFETREQIPINGDLPVPTFSVTTQLGVASSDAARPFPAGARAAGEGFHARGMVVQCPGASMSGLGAIDPAVSGYMVAGAAGGAFLGWLFDAVSSREPAGSMLGNVIGGALLGVLVGHVIATR